MSDDGFKIVDKRRFSDSGETRSDDQHSEDTSYSSSVKSNPADSHIFENNHDHLDTDSYSGEVDFPSFIMGLATQTMVMLGEIPHPETNLPMVNLEAAHQTIDILGLLEVKTKGNLSKDEERLLQDLLANLRLAYVDKARNA